MKKEIKSSLKIYKKQSISVGDCVEADEYRLGEYGSTQDINVVAHTKRRYIKVNSL
jgi:hypothetical protein